MDILPWHQYSIVGHDGAYLSLCEVFLPRRFSDCTFLTFSVALVHKRTMLVLFPAGIIIHIRVVQALSHLKSEAVQRGEGIFQMYLPSAFLITVILKDVIVHSVHWIAVN
jgi:hypothetical protein